MPVAELPTLMFPSEELLLPGSRKVLHLYEARFLALLDQSMNEVGGLLAHVVFHPLDDTSGDKLAVDRVATLCRIAHVERQDVGARVELVGEARLQLCDIVSTEPFVKGVFRQVRTMADNTLYVPTESEVVRVELLVTELRAMLADILVLSDKLGTRGAVAEAGGEDTAWNEWGHMEISSLEQSLKWVDGPSVLLAAVQDRPTTMADVEWQQPAEKGRSAMEVAERLSFAIMQVAPAASVSDVRRLTEARVEAMALETGLLARLNTAYEVLDEQLKTLRAKVALKSLQF